VHFNFVLRITLELIWLLKLCLPCQMVLDLYAIKLNVLSGRYESENDFSKSIELVWICSLEQAVPSSVFKFALSLQRCFQDLQRRRLPKGDFMGGSVSERGHHWYYAACSKRIGGPKVATSVTAPALTAPDPKFIVHTDTSCGTNDRKAAVAIHVDCENLQVDSLKRSAPPSSSCRSGTKEAKLCRRNSEHVRLPTARIPAMLSHMQRLLAPHVVGQCTGHTVLSFGKAQRQRPKINTGVGPSGFRRITVRAHCVVGGLDASLRKSWPQELALPHANDVYGRRPVSDVLAAFEATGGATKGLILALCTPWEPSTYDEAMFLMRLGVLQGSGNWAICATILNDRFHIALVAPSCVGGQEAVRSFAAAKDASVRGRTSPDLPDQVLWWAFVWKSKGLDSCTAALECL